MSTPAAALRDRARDGPAQARAAQVMALIEPAFLAQTPGHGAHRAGLPRPDGLVLRPPRAGPSSWPPARCPTGVPGKCVHDYCHQQAAYSVLLASAASRRRTWATTTSSCPPHQPSRGGCRGRAWWPVAAGVQASVPAGLCGTRLGQRKMLGLAADAFLAHPAVVPLAPTGPQTKEADLRAVCDDPRREGGTSATGATCSTTPAA